MKGYKPPASAARTGRVIGSTEQASRAFSRAVKQGWLPWKTPPRPQIIDIECYRHNRDKKLA